MIKNSQGDNYRCSTRDENSLPSRPFSPRATSVRVRPGLLAAAKTWPGRRTMAPVIPMDGRFGLQHVVDVNRMLAPEAFALR